MATHKSLEEKTFGKNKYTIHLLGARRAFTIGRGIVKVFPSAGSFFDAQFSDALDGLKFSTVATVFIENLEDLEIDDILEEVVFSKLIINGQDANIDDHFQANLGEMLDVVAWALEVNFKSLFLGSTLVSKMLSKLKGMGLIPQKDIPQEETEAELEQE